MFIAAALLCVALANDQAVLNAFLDQIVDASEYPSCEKPILTCDDDNNELTWTSPRTCPSNIEIKASGCKITSISLNGYSLSDFPETIFGFKNLKTLKLVKNGITSLPIRIGELYLLSSLQVSLNNIGTVPTQIGNLINLKGLNLNGCSLQNLPKELFNITALTYLSIYPNMIKSLPSDVGKLGALTYLGASNNQLSTLPPEFANLKNLNKIYLHSNSFKEFPEPITKLPQLNYIDIKYNEIKSIPESFCDLESLTYLTISYNLLTGFPENIGSLTFLTYLNAAVNSITSLPSSFTRMTQMRDIRLNNNKFVSLPTEMGSFTKLETLCVANNFLTTIPKQFSKLTALAIKQNELDYWLKGNYLKCSEVVAYMPEALKENWCVQEQQNDCSNGCSEGNKISICEGTEDNCSIKCGSDSLKEGDYCSLCSVHEDGCSACIGEIDKVTCNSCYGGYEYAEHECTECDEGTFSLDGGNCQPCSNMNCVTCSTTGVCSMCTAGYGLQDGACSPCTGNEYSLGKDACTPVDENCKTANPAMKQCLQCVDGFGLVDNRCFECGKSEYSDGNGACQKNPNCVDSARNGPVCNKCEPGYALMNDACTKCVGNTFSDGTDACQTAQALCEESDPTKNFCLKCKSGYGVINGVCNPVKTIYIAMCVILVVILIAIVVFDVVYGKNVREYILKNKHKTVEELELEEAMFSNFQFSPHHLTFRGKQADAGVEVTDRLKLANKSNKPLVVVFNDIPVHEAYNMKWDKKKVTIPANGETDVNLAVTLNYNYMLSTTLEFVVHDKRNKFVLREYKIPVALSGKASMNISIKEITRGDEIGSGSYGSVFAGRYMGKDVAIKYLNGKSNAAIEEFKREVDIMKQVKGPNIVLFYGAVLGGPDYCHVTELMDLGSLDRVLKNNNIDAIMKVKMMKDVARGMETIHSFNIIHRDLKPENVLCHTPLTLDNNELCKITDFGTSRGIIQEVSLTMTKGQGTPVFMAPEILTGETHYDNTVDVYSFGILMASVWNDGAMPYMEYEFKNHIKLQNEILNGCRPKLKTDCPTEIASLMHSCWSADPKERRQFSDIYKYLESVFESFN